MLRSTQHPFVAPLLLLLAAGCANPEPQDGPRLMVMLVVDQLIPEQLDRYDEHYSGGLRRLLDDGFRYDDAAHDHGVTETAAGHATLSTGVYPKTHGIVANDWYEFDAAGEARFVYAVADSLSSIVGIPERVGTLAPQPGARRHGRLGPGRRFRSPRGLGLQERPGGDHDGGNGAGARLLARCRTGALRDLQLVPAVGTPAWVEDFNRDARTRLLSDSVWQSTIPRGLWSGSCHAGMRPPTRPTGSTRPFHIGSTRKVTHPRPPASTSGWRSGPWWTRRRWRWR